MYPYDNWWKWVLKPKQAHLVDALEDRPGIFDGPEGEALRLRLAGIRTMLKVRAGLLALLSFSVVAAVVSWLVWALGEGAEVAAAVETARTWVSAWAGVTWVLYLLTMRTLQQLEIDSLLLLPSNRARWDGLPSPPVQPVNLRERVLAPDLAVHSGEAPLLRVRADG